MSAYTSFFLDSDEWDNVLHDTFDRLISKTEFDGLLAAKMRVLNMPLADEIAEKDRAELRNFITSLEKDFGDHVPQTRIQWMLV